MNLITPPSPAAVRRAAGKAVAGDAHKPVLLIGGDHPYAQWKDSGFARLYSDNGLKPYLAVNTDTTGRNNIDPGNADMLTWAELAALSGVEVVAHGARHIQGWTRLNTGVQIQYSGANATATVQVSSTQIIGTAGADSFTLTLSSYTLATLEAAIEAVTGWAVTLAPELTGDEPATTLLQIAATSTKSVNQRFACGGGVSVLYNGTAYREVMVQVASNTLKVFADGVRVGSISLTGGATLSSLVTSINALGVSGLSAKLCDNQKAESSGFESFVSGSELAASLATLSPGRSCLGHPAVLNAGLPHWYMVERQLQRCKDQLAANGITARAFASSGAEFLSSVRNGHTQFTNFRGNGWGNIDTTLPSSVSVPTYLAQHFRPVAGFTATNYNSAKIKALWRALQDSPGHTVDALVHKLLADGTTSYSFPSSDLTYYDQTETVWVDAVQDVGARVAAGSIENVQPSDLELIASRAPRPVNYLFNATLQNSGESMIVSSTDERIIPGWLLLAASADFSAAAVSGAAFDATLLTASERTPLRQHVYLESGRTYEIGAYVEVIGYASGNGVSLQLNALRGVQRDGWPAQQTNTNRSRFTTARSDHVSMRFTVPAAVPFAPARIVSASFGSGLNLSTNKNIRLNIFAKGAFDIDVSAGAASATSVQAHEAAAAINAAIKANSAYPAELHNVARAENGRVILEVPKRGPDGSFQMTVVDGTTASITATMFGSSDNLSWARAADFDAFAVPMEFRVAVALSSGARFKVSNPYIADVMSL